MAKQFKFSSCPVCSTRYGNDRTSRMKQYVIKEFAVSGPLTFRQTQSGIFSDLGDNLPPKI